MGPELPPGAVVARLAYPMPATGLGKLVKALEALYGPGLVIVTGGARWRPNLMTIATPGGTEPEELTESDRDTIARLRAGESLASVVEGMVGHLDTEPGPEL